MQTGQIWELAHLTLKPEAVAGFPKAAASALDVIRTAEGCKAAHLLLGVESPERPVFLILWDDVAAHLAFRDAASFGDYRAPIQDSFASAPTFEHFEVAGS